MTAPPVTVTALGDVRECPLCGFNLIYKRAGGEYSRLLGFCVRGVYDGVLFWQCPDCGTNFHRWPEGHRLREVAAEWVTDDEQEQRPERLPGPGDGGM